MDQDKVLRRWDDFIDKRGLPYFSKQHKQMMRQVLDRYPLRKLSDVSDRDLLDCVTVTKQKTSSGSKKPFNGIRKFRFFLGHLDSFLSNHGLGRS